MSGNKKALNGHVEFLRQVFNLASDFILIQRA